MKKYKTGEYEKRPWGSWEVLSDETLNPGSIVKRIIVHPKQRLSLQYHFYRNENWFVTKGEATVEINGEQSVLGFGETVFIPKGATHRISNNGDEDVIIIEIQHGKILDENDIVRLEDDYNRQLT